MNGTGIVSIDKVDKWKEAIMSYFGRVNYNYKEKYLIEANAVMTALQSFSRKIVGISFMAFPVDGELPRNLLWKW